MRLRLAYLGAAGLLAALATGTERAGAQPREAAPLATSRPADPANGRRIVMDRRKGFCLICHSGPFPEERFQGDLAPTLAGVGTRLSAGEIRLRLIDSRAIHGRSIMPPYFRAEGGERVSAAFAGRPILNAEEIEDVVSFLQTLRD